MEKEKELLQKKVDELAKNLSTIVDTLESQFAQERKKMNSMDVEQAKSDELLKQLDLLKLQIEKERSRQMQLSMDLDECRKIMRGLAQERDQVLHENQRLSNQVNDLRQNLDNAIQV